MTGDPLGDGTPAARARLVKQLDRMIERGQVTAEEAARIREADNDHDFDAAVLVVRLRHAGARIGAAVERGQMTAEEAENNLEKLRRGEHPRALRSHLRKLAQRSH